MQKMGRGREEMMEIVLCFHLTGQPLLKPSTFQVNLLNWFWSKGRERQ